MDDVRGRHLNAAFWMVVLVSAVGSLLFDVPQAGIFAFATALAVLVSTALMANLTREERLARPVVYRVATSVLLVSALAGGLIALVPRASEKSQILGVFFALAALLAYRALVARGPRRALFAVVIAMWAWIPFFVATLIGCKCRIERAPHWSELASTSLLAVVVLLLPVLAASALLAFVPRRDEVPDMRVVR